MSNQTYTLGRPAGNLTPAQNRPSMTVNNDSNAALWDIDHYGFNNNNGGEHRQVTFPIATSPVPSASGPLGVLYSALDASSASQLFFKNKNGTIQLTGVSGSDQITGSITGPGGGSYVLFTLPFGFKIFTGFVGSQNGSRNMTLNGATFGSTIYTASATVFGAGPIATSISPNASASTFNIQSANTAPIYFLVITN